MFLKRGLAAALAAVTVIGLAGCGGSDDAAEADTATVKKGFVEKKVEPVNFDSGVELTSDCYHFIYALGNAPATIDAAKFFKMRLEQESKGTLSCDIYTDNVLGSERELLEGCQFGNYDIVLATNATVASFENDIFCLDIPWLFDNKQQVYEVLDGPLGDRLADGLEESGFKLLQWQENGFRTLSTNKPINDMSDLKGVKIRIMENELQLQQWKDYGANPTPMAFTELFTALQQKTVDAQDNGAELTWQTKFYEVQSHYTYTKHIYSPYLILMSKDKFDGLTPEQQEIVMTAAANSVTFERELMEQQNNDARTFLEGEGIEFIDEAVAYERQRCDEYEQTALDNIKNCGTMQYSDLTPEVKAEMVKACKNIKELAYKKVTDPSVVDLLYDEVAKAKEKFPEEG